MLGHNHKGYLVVLGQLWAVLVGTSRYLVSKGRCSSVFGGTESVLGGTGWYLLVLGRDLQDSCFSRILGNFFHFHFSLSIWSRFNFTFTSRKRVKGSYFSLFTSR